MQLPEKEHSIEKLIDSCHESIIQTPRAHLGCSQLGGVCQRAIWLKFRWAVVEQFEGRMLRLFRRGQNEESTIISDLTRIGCFVSHTGRDQMRVYFGSFVSGSIDGIIESGLPGAPKTRHILECKTHNDKSFRELKAKGVYEAKHEHWVQMQCYMLGSRIDRALYAAVNKNDDEYYFERVKLEKEKAEEIVEKAKRLALSDRIQEPISSNPTWYQCKFCACHDFCFGSRIAKQINCRTCAHSTFRPDSNVFCERHQEEVSTEWQTATCVSHCLHPDMVPWKLDQEKSTKWSACYDGKLNGQDGISSAEMIASIDSNYKK